MKNTSPLRLPHEIVHDILLCLPAKSLQRFKLVAKPWGSLISDPTFAESHLHRANTSQDNDNLLRVGQIKLSTEGTGKFLSLYSMDSNGSNREVVTLDYNFERYGEGAQILGSCNGLLLIAAAREIFLIWNPLTRKCERIPRCVVTEDGMFLSALGYAFTSGNYKGIIISYCNSRPSSNESLYYNIYYYERNSWACHYEFPYRLCSDSLGVMVNGVPHWPVYHRGLDRTDGEEDDNDRIRVTYLIVCFNWENEKFMEVELPAWAMEEMKFTLTRLRGCLSILVDHPHGSSSSTEVWAMKEYGLPESWAKLFVIPYPFETLRPICFAGKKEVLLEVDGKRLIIFDLEENTTKEVLLTLEPCEFKVFTYMGSLVFPGEYGKEANHARGIRDVTYGVLSEGFEDEINGS